MPFQTSLMLGFTAEEEQSLIALCWDVLAVGGGIFTPHREIAFAILSELGELPEEDL